MIRYALPLLALALAACGEKDTEVAEGTASGEVLPGSISDDMIALDQLRSEAPSDPTGESVPDTGSDDDAVEADDVGGDAPAAPAPAAPAPEPSAQPQPKAQAQPKAAPKAAPSEAPPPPVSVLPKKTDDN
ncbi:hypothetical protein [Pseudoblastomonas halimionae]|uniref:Lipoprotein n=1 Tax=Alteriqipengyuania halimionae TaxID=1926630 RepID=A0A6I4U3I7_9SPHN|nr:hypothetical protein [Alteriqipengyuania halimionae]MXP10498.1 hypothetical protein [Alteriqipengyuania halimionae]